MTEGEQVKVFCIAGENTEQDMQFANQFDNI